jgi:alkylmercury lyase-like protein
MNMNADDLRIFTYDHLVANGFPPTLDEIATHFGVTRFVARKKLEALKIGKTILLRPHSGEIWMAGPFSATRTDYEVVAGNRTYYANCAWDMLGIPIVLNEPVEIRTKCTDCGAAMTISGDPTKAPSENGVVHFLVPAGRWYEDIGFT